MEHSDEVVCRGLRFGIPRLAQVTHRVCWLFKHFRCARCILYATYLSRMKHYLDAAEKAARAAGKLLRKNFRRPQRVNAVAAHDIKLEIDVQAQELITRLLLKEFPKHALYGEEGMVGDQSSEHQWVVDPLDGTVNYFYGIPHFCTSIALRLRNEVMVGVIYDPIRREMWKGQKGEIPKLNGDPYQRKRSRRSR